MILRCLPSLLFGIALARFNVSYTQGEFWGWMIAFVILDGIAHWEKE